MNIWNFTGNLGKDSEVRYLPSGEAICTFSVAVSSGYGDKKKTTWPNCALFGKAASGNLPKYLTQGTQVAVSGEVTLDEWEANDGTKRTTLKVNVLKIDLIGSSNQKNGSSAGQQQPQRQQAPQQQPPAGFDDDFEGSDLPF